MLFEISKELIFVNVILELLADEIFPFIGGIERIDDENIGVAFVIQPLQEHAADKPCAAGKKNHGG